jgi:hypothetical protein
VKDSFSSIRAAFENGLSVTGCYVAHLLNAKRHYWIFQTGKKQTNNCLQEHQAYAPIELGLYPFYAPAIMQVTSPEIHNYFAFKHVTTENNLMVLNAYKNIYIGTQMPEKRTIRIVTRQLLKMKRYKERLRYNKKEINEILEQNALAPYGKSTCLRDEVFKMKYTLGQEKSEEALTSKNKLMLLGRTGAYSSKSCFTMRDLDSLSFDFNADGVMEKLLTFKEIVTALSETTNEKEINIDDNFSDHVTYKKYASHFIEPRNLQALSKPRDIMSGRLLKIREENAKIPLPILTVLECAWMKKEIPEKDLSKLERSLSTIKAQNEWFDEQSLARTKDKIGTDIPTMKILNYLINTYSTILSSSKCIPKLSIWVVVSLRFLLGSLIIASSLYLLTWIFLLDFLVL